MIRHNHYSLLKVFLPLFIIIGFNLITSWRVQAATILVYHHVSETTPKSTSVTLEQFEQHLDLIDELGLKVVPASAISDAIKTGKNIPAHWTAITFDDGYRSVYDNAFPMLKQRGWPFTVFVNPKMVKPSKLYMSWQQLQQINKEGGEIANHTLAHDNMVKTDKTLEQIKQQLLDSEQMIIDHIGSSPKLLAYPYGEYSEPLMDLLAELDIAAFVQHSGAVNNTTRLQAITRFPANGIYANPKTLKTKLSSLPFAIKSISPIEPVIAVDSEDSNINIRPKVQVELLEKDFYKSQLACFISGEDKPVKAIWIDKLTFEVQSAHAIGKGRIKYNCTAPSIKHRGKFYWWSKLWFKLDKV